MLTNKRSSRYSSLGFLVGVFGIGIGLLTGFLVGVSPLLIGLPIFAVAVLVWFFAQFEQAVIGLLVLRSALDTFSAQQLPAAFAVGLDGLALLYVVVSLLTGQAVKVDKFWWFFAGWVALQAMWVVLLPLGGLGLDSTYLFEGVREWTRLFSWLMVYLLVMQLQGKVKPQTLITTLFLSLVIPLTVASMQMFLPASLLPSFLAQSSVDAGSLEPASRIRGTLGHPSSFATFLLLFIGFTCWKIRDTRNRAPWLFLLAILTVFFVSTKALTMTAMLFVFVFVMIAPKLNLLNLMGGILLLGLVILLFTSTDFGRERLGSLSDTPLLNPHMDMWRAILLSWTDGNSFNWRIAQWHFIWEAWKNAPLFGYGLSTASYVTVLQNEAHNDYLRALVEGGIVGFMTFISLIAAQIYRLVHIMFTSPKNSSQQNFCFILIALLSAILLGMFTDNIWKHTTLFFYWWLSLSVVGWDWNQTPPSDTKNYQTPVRCLRS
ncbi:O-antigen ligase family protein [Nostoc sp. CMAA1605]|uniref:O-antigen ligase family protein n=1 Tax=Nostoc sp. CMAA1605 TaxID=2055159 RepID=UPI001F3EADFE|nr:O-antigen ligase family protein [Nostoc sp. CMAA1605]MCF4968755.1 polymerase [Nostoc sp. CMAA1605]